MSDTHTFETFLAWPADAAQKLPSDLAFWRDGVVAAPGKPDIPGSSPSVFGGDATRYSPEELPMLSLSECHMLTYLAIAAKKRLGILKSQDRVTGTLAFVFNMMWEFAHVRFYTIWATADGMSDESSGSHFCTLGGNRNWVSRSTGTKRAMKPLAEGHHCNPV